MKKKLSVILIVLTLAFVMGGCNSEIYLYYMPDGDEAYYVLDIKMDNTELKALEESAKKGAVYSDYSLPEFEGLGSNHFSFEIYIITLLEYRSDFTFIDKITEPQYTTFSFQTMNPVAAEDDELRLDLKMEEKPGLFYFYYNYEATNPMTDYRQKYDAAATNASGSSLESIMQNGWMNYTTGKKLMPSFAEAFPIAADKAQFDLDKLKLNYLLQLDYKLNTQGEMLRDSNGSRYYLYKELSMNNNAEIKFQMRRANTVSWNILSIIFGFIAVGGVILAANLIKNNKEKPKKTNTIADFADRLPYNPNDNDPFAGY